MSVNYLSVRGETWIDLYLIYFRAKVDSMDILFADFDGVLFHVSNHGSDKTKVKVCTQT